MSLTTIISEIFRMLRDRWKTILLGMTGIALVTIFVQLFLSSYVNQMFGDEEEGQDVESQHQLLVDRYEVEPAEFQFFAQNEAGELFQNSFIFDEYFTSQAVVDQMERETGVEVSDVLLAEEELGIEKASDYRGSIAGIRDTSSNSIIFRVQVGETEEENLRLAEWIEQKVSDNDMPFSDSLYTVILNPASVGEMLSEENQMFVSSPEALDSVVAISSFGRQSVILYGILGLILGFIITVGLLLLYRILTGKLKYAFEYVWDFDDQHFILDSQDPNYQDQLDHILSQPANDKLLLSEDRETAGPRDADEVVFFIKEGKTSRRWYNENYKLYEGYGIHKKIIHIV